MSGSSAFDQGGGGMFHMDPLSFALAGAAQAMGQASQPSRLPAGIGSVIGMGAGGFAQGLMGGQQYQHAGLQNQALGLQNKLLEASMPSQLGMLNAANQYWSNQMQPASGGAGAPFGVPSAGGGGMGATPASTGTPRVGASLGGGTPDYLLSPYEVKANMMFAMAKGQDTAAARFAGMLESMAGPGHALNRQGAAFAIPGSVGDPSDIYARELATKQAGVGPALQTHFGEQQQNVAAKYATPETVAPGGALVVPGQMLGNMLPGGNPFMPGGQQQPAGGQTGSLWQRNNNPGNIRFAGQPGAQQGAGGFAAFPDMQTGAAAIYGQLQHYQQRGQTTISQMIGGIGQPGQPGYVPGYAPPTENDTPKYIANLSLRTGIAPNQPVNLQDPRQAALLVNGIMQQETGGKFGLANLGQTAPGAQQGNVPQQTGAELGSKGGPMPPAAVSQAAPPSMPPTGGQPGPVQPVSAAGGQSPQPHAPGTLYQNATSPLTINMGRPAAEEAFKGLTAIDTKQVEKATEEANALAPQQQITQSIRSYLPEVATGLGADEIAYGARLATRLGADENAVKAISGMKPSESELLLKNFYRLTALQVKEQEGARPASSMVMNFMKAYPNMESRPETIDAMTRGMDMDYTYKSDRADAMRNWLTEAVNNGAKTNTYEGLRGFQKEFDLTNNPRAYAAAAEAAAGFPEKEWSRGLTADQVVQAKELAKRVYPEDYDPTPGALNGVARWKAEQQKQHAAAQGGQSQQQGAQAAAAVPNPAAISHLMAHPELRKEFEAKYGPGTADRAIDAYNNHGGNWR